MKKENHLEKVWREGFSLFQRVRQGIRRNDGIDVARKKFKAIDVRTIRYL